MYSCFVPSTETEKGESKNKRCKDQESSDYDFDYSWDLLCPEGASEVPRFKPNSALILTFRSPFTFSLLLNAFLYLCRYGFSGVQITKLPSCLKSLTGSLSPLDGRRGIFLVKTVYRNWYRFQVKNPWTMRDHLNSVLWMYRSHLPPLLPSSAPTPAVTSALYNHPELQRGSEHGLCLASDSGSALRLLGTCYLTSVYLSLLLSNMGIIVVAIS